ncbi:Fdo1p [Kluyveromyces lactis]|uniref:KLLA0E21957p n=1 Tax=Kluyveromyces lactis (strain ATCC 8585 / CBS 2359 / DSM 70799 / NBRC 1267 / NRRL Y-1140 / WM37) TaxID=284590 RepID=Q6CM94_KLULA|nr:uncharacterized protein KLLA0_E21957g [Kluyveromyces lactis]CAH00032.1 KLLA0E21957p [Kluyveromyces lactis]|eukprot:XP_454945.1 uncharacterized protein KLLA0_E21957g [Kluyveromyces lactis]
MTETQLKTEGEVNNVHSPSVIFTPNDLERKSSTISNTSSISTQEDSLNDQVSLAIENAQRTLNTLNALQSTAEIPASNHKGDTGSDDTKNGTADEKDKDVNNDIITSLRHLMTALTKSQERAKQLTLKNMFLVQNLNELQSGFQVEQNLAKQQFESMKYNLMVQKTDLQRQLEGTSVKITKYRETIMSKNKEINRLSRLLNQSQVYNPRLSRPTSVPSASVRKPFISRQLHSSDSNMLNTLGILATKVLKEEQNPENGSIHGSTLQHSPIEDKPENLDNTESDISHDSTQLVNHSQQFNNGLSPSTANMVTPAASVPAAQHLPSLSTVSEVTPDSHLIRINSSSNQKIERPELPILHLNRPSLPKGAALPKLRSFNTADGTVKDVL